MAVDHDFLALDMLNLSYRIIHCGIGGADRKARQPARLGTGTTSPDRKA
jgi:hypothetical protein